MSRPLRFAAIGLDHRHIYHLVGELIEAGAECAGYCAETSDPRVLDGFRERFPQLQSVERERLFDDSSIDIIVSAAIPRDRPAIAIRAMRAGKDVMVDKPGATTLDQVAQIEAVALETSRIFSICFSERFVVRACEAATRLVEAGEIGKVVHTVGLGPHRLNRAIRPAWFFRREDDEFRSRPERPFPLRLPSPNTLSQPALGYAGADAVDNTGPVTMGGHPRKGHGPKPRARLPVRGVPRQKHGCEPELRQPRVRGRGFRRPGERLRLVQSSRTMRPACAPSIALHQLWFPLA